MIPLLLTGFGSSGPVLPANQFTLDLMVTAGLSINSNSGWFALRKLRTAYAGSAIQVRRSSDNTTQDIGFAASGWIDQTALLAFTGAGNGFVSKWYDQGGNSRDLAQSTNGSQPQIVASGVVKTLVDNLTPCVLFSSSTTLNGTASNCVNGTSGDAHMGGQFGAVSYTWFDNTLSSDGWTVQVIANQAIEIDRKAVIVLGTTSTGVFSLNTKLLMGATQAQSASWGAFVNGSSVGSGAHAQGIANANTKIGGGNFSATDFFVPAAVLAGAVRTAMWTSQKSVLGTP